MLHLVSVATQNQLRQLHLSLLAANQIQQQNTDKCCASSPRPFKRSDAYNVPSVLMIRSVLFPQTADTVNALCNYGKEDNCVLFCMLT
jgi:hypothetical protein